MSERHPGNPFFWHTQAELDEIMNRIQLRLAKSEQVAKNIIAGWKKPANLAPRKTDEELDAEDALMFRPEPPHLGVGCPAPEDYMVPDAEELARRKILDSKIGKGLIASKKRERERRLEIVRRAEGRAEESDEEEGRSSLGKNKKRKLKAEVMKEAVKYESEDEGVQEQKISKETMDEMKALFSGATAFKTEEGTKEGGKDKKRKLKTKSKKDVKKETVKEVEDDGSQKISKETMDEMKALFSGAADFKKGDTKDEGKVDFTKVSEDSSAMLPIRSNAEKARAKKERKRLRKEQQLNSQ